MSFRRIGIQYMTVSVLVAVYNRENTLRKAVESIACQLNSEDEILISDDESTDSTLEIAKQLASKYPIIKILHHKRNGIDEHMRFLINQASKDIIIIADSDDESLPLRVETIKEAYRKNEKINCVYHNAKVIDEDGNITSDNFFKSFRQQNKLLHMFIKSTFFGACMSFKTSFGKEVVEISTGVDLAWDKCIGFAAKRNKCILFLNDDILLHYRRWKDNISVSKRPFFEKVKEKLVSWKCYRHAKIKSR